MSALAPNSIGNGWHANNKRGGNSGSYHGHDTRFCFRSSQFSIFISTRICEVTSVTVPGEFFFCITFAPLLGLLVAKKKECMAGLQLTIWLRYFTPVLIIFIYTFTLNSWVCLHSRRLAAKAFQRMEHWILEERPHRFIFHCRWMSQMFISSEIETTRLLSNQPTM